MYRLKSNSALNNPKMVDGLGRKTNQPTNESSIFLIGSKHKNESSFFNLFIYLFLLSELKIDIV